VRALAGVTLLELMVVLAILGCIGGVMLLASWRGDERIDGRRPVHALRAAAILGGSTVTTSMEHRGRHLLVTAFPDGIVVADAALAIEPLSGAHADQ
jgi:prepilin-type N-terminal cleavage/methylation domain-containing protein